MGGDGGERDAAAVQAAVGLAGVGRVILPRTAGGTLAAQFPPPLKELLLDHLTAAA